MLLSDASQDICDAKTCSYVQVLFRNMRAEARNDSSDIGLMEGLPPGTSFTTSAAMEGIYRKVSALHRM